MPQGKSKLNAAKQSSGGKKKVADKKKGLRAIPPKKTVTVRQATQHKVSWRFGVVWLDQTGVWGIGIDGSVFALLQSRYFGIASDRLYAPP